MDNIYENIKFYYCYSADISKFLRYECKIPFITKALHPKTYKPYTMFFRTPELEEGLKLYHELKEKETA